MRALTAEQRADRAHQARVQRWSKTSKAAEQAIKDHKASQSKLAAKDESEKLRLKLECDHRAEQLALENAATRQRAETICQRRSDEVRAQNEIRHNQFASESELRHARWEEELHRLEQDFDKILRARPSVEVL